jgi:hypothetical protein
MKLEGKVQQEIVMWFRNVYAQGKTPRPIIFSVPNENQQRFISTGMLPGASDLIVVLQNDIYFVEVKSETGTQKPKQKEFEKRITDLGYKYILVRSLEGFINEIIYGKN